MSVVLSVADVGPWKKELKVEVPLPAVTAELERVVREYSRNARLPGFRKGKAPASVVRKRFGDEIEREVIDRLVPRYWHQAQAEKSLEPIGGPQIESVDLQPGSPMTFVATVEVRPEIELSKNRGFVLPEPQTQVTDGDIDRVMERLRVDRGPWNVVDRPAARGDRVSLRLLDVEHQGTENVAADVDQQGQPVEVEVGDEGVWEELTLALTGLAAGQGGEFRRSHAGHGGSEEDHQHRYLFSVLEVKEKEPLPLDEGLARAVGDFESLDALRAQIRRRLEADKRAEAHRQRERALIDQLCERNPLELPEGVVQNEIEAMIKEYAETLARSGVDVERSGIDWRAMLEQARPQARRRVHSRFLLDRVAEEDRIEVSEEEFEATLRSIARAQKSTTVAVRQALDRAGTLEGLRRQLRRNKVLRRLLGEDDSSESPESDLLRSNEQGVAVDRDPEGETSGALDRAADAS